MTPLQMDANHWHDKISEIIEEIYDVKDGALGRPFSENDKWHEKLSRVASELRLLGAWLHRLADTAQ